MASEKLRKCLDELHRISVETGDGINRKGALLDAYLYRSRVKCGRATCKCMLTGYRHEKWCLSFKEKGRSRTLTVPDAWLPRIRETTDAYRQTRKLIRQFAARYQAVADALARRVVLRVATGRELLDKLIATKTESREKGTCR